MKPSLLGDHPQCTAGPAGRAPQATCCSRVAQSGRLIRPIRPIRRIGPISRNPGSALLVSRFTFHALLLLACLSPAGAVRLSEPYYKITDQVVTPHIAWAKPYCKGKLRVLAIAPRWTQRESVELAQRLDADITPVLTYGFQKLGLDPANPGWVSMEGAFLPDVEADLTRALQPDYDCIVMGAFAWNLLPRRSQYLILKKVSEGTGLIYFYPKVADDDTLAKALAKKKVADEAGFLTTAVPFEALSAFQPNPEDKRWQPVDRATFLDLHEFKGGRIALVRYAGRPGNLYCTPQQAGSGQEVFTEYEYYQSLAIRSIVWAARKESGFLLRMPAPAAPLANPAPVLSFALENGGAAASVRVQATVRDPWHEAEVSRAVSLAAKPGANRVALPALPLKTGRHFLDDIATVEGKVVAWGSMAFETTGPTRVSEVVLPRDSWEKEETLAAAVTVAGVTRPRALDAFLRDTHGRVWARQSLTVRPGAGPATVRFPLANALTIAHHLVVRVVDGPRVVSEAVHEFYVQQRDQSDFYLLQWPNSSRDYVGRQFIRQAARLGTDFFSNSGASESATRPIALENVRAIPYMTRYAGNVEKDKLVTTPCFTDPRFLEGQRGSLADNTEKLKRFSLAGYTLGDECFLQHDATDACMSPTCNADFVEYLRGVYPSLDALNKEWGTTLADWKDATPTTLAEARQTGQLARWADHRLHMESTFAAVMRNAVGAIRAKDPQARVGFDGPFGTTSFAGYDWWKLSREFNMVGLYWHQPEQTEQMRSFLPARTSPTGYWYGGYYGWRREGHERYVPWHTLLHGFNSAWWFALCTDASPSDEEDAFSPDLRPYPEFLWTVEECNAIKKGIGKLLLQARRQQDGIAVLYSQASVHAATLQPAFGTVTAAQNGADWLLEDAGLQYDYLSYAELAGGELGRRGYRALVLPHCQAISVEEAQQIRRFVEAGGLLLADVGAGRMDGHCKPGAQGMLDDLFGVRFAGEPKKVHGSLHSDGAGPATANLTVDADAGVQVAGGQARSSVEGTPAVIVNRVGKGTAVLLNFPFAPYAGTRAGAGSDPYVSLVGSLLAEAGVKPRATFAATGGRLRAFEAVFHKDGANEYLSVLPIEGSGQEGPAVITLERKAHVYDVRAGKDLGVTATIKTEIQPARAKVFALLPYAVGGVTAAVRVGDGRLATVAAVVQTAGAPAGTHCLHIEVDNPAGKPAPWYTRNVLAPRGKASFTLPFALSDAAGKWRVRITDAATGKTTVVAVVLAAGS